MGRPLKQIDPVKVRRMARIGCTVEEIAVVLGVSKDTLERRFAAYIEKGREGGKSSLRRYQWKAAKAGNTTMQIWLGKQLLSQTDRQTHEHTGSGGGPIVTENHFVLDYDQARTDLETFARGGTKANGNGNGSAHRRAAPNGNGKPVHSGHAD